MSDTPTTTASSPPVRGGEDWRLDYPGDRFEGELTLREAALEVVNWFDKDGAAGTLPDYIMDLRAALKAERECCVPDAGEPSFVLLGRDPQAPGLVFLWAHERARLEPDSPKPAMACEIAERMRAYKLENPERGFRSASAPSPDQAGAGGDLEELRKLQEAAEDAHEDYFERGYGSYAVMASTRHAFRDAAVEYVEKLLDPGSGHLLASTAGRGGEDQTGACLTAPDYSGSAPSPMVSASGEYPSRSQSGMIRRLTEEYCRVNWPSMSPAGQHYARNHMTDALRKSGFGLVALGTEAEGQDAESGLVHEGPAPQGATP